MYEDAEVINSISHKYEDIDRNKKIFFKLKKNKEILYKDIVNINESFLYRKRTRMASSTSGVNGTETCHIFAKFTRNGKKVVFIFENGETVVKDNFKENTKWFYSPVIKPFEELKD